MSLLSTEVEINPTDCWLITKLVDWQFLKRAQSHKNPVINRSKNKFLVSLNKMSYLLYGVDGWFDEKNVASQ